MMIMEAAIRITGKQLAALAEIEKPQSPAPGHLLGKTRYSLISPGTELHALFLNDRTEPADTGYASVFEVEQTADDVTGFRPGDLVFCMHNHQSFQHVPASQAVLVPEGLDPAAAPISRLMNVSMTTLMTTTARPGDKVIVSGAGPVGFLAAHVFKHNGYDVMVIDPMESRLETVRASGISQAAASLPLEDPAWKQKVALVVECSGHESAVLDACRIVRPRGEVVMIGVPWKRYTDHYAHELLSLVFHHYVVLRSGWEWELPVQSGHFQPHSIMGNLGLGLRWLSEGFLDVQAYSRLMSPHEVQDTYDGLASRRFDELFVLFDWSRLG
ncbi:zinc-dependent alcohol dehydrogenase [Paenibacillus nasutitermitis]|uniref:Dehydrogenase n=1 Tax=Paenibacillus nasutitermitis TaxID=1652958 RepID=A0A916Z810_9BACL|nr:zinc-binding alcohol dehydrogenase [Paenibacillus nasutitermitis]GGD79595.1 dehydrogenase [Paenibacillus nasutitermitis]